MLSTAGIVAFVATTDGDRARDFYEGKLELELLERTPFALVFSVPGASLRVTYVDELVPAPYTVVGWQVEGIERVIDELSGRGVDFVQYEQLDQSESGVWTSPSGARVAWFQDPDGNVLSLTETAPAAT